MQEIANKYQEITEKLKSFSDEYLNEEYKNLCLEAAENLFTNKEVDLKKGKSFSWAAGIVHAIGSINTLFDSKEEPYIKASDLYKAFGVSSSTGLSKSKEIKNILDIREENKKWLINKSLEEKQIEKVEQKNEQAEEKRLELKIDKNYIIAQRLVNLAWREKTFKNKAKVAKQALELCENCSDAYIILSKDTSLTKDEKKEILQKAVLAGKNVLNIDDMEKADKAIFRTKLAEPFFGAQYILATFLWENNERDQAINQAYNILKYNEMDNIMVRGLLSSWLLIENRIDEAKELLENYENDKLASINYNKAALLYKIGEVKKAEKALIKAFKLNSLVIPYILKQKKVPTTFPNMNRFGKEEEAIQYGTIGMEVWNNQDLQQWVKATKKDFDFLNR